MSNPPNFSRFFTGPRRVSNKIILLVLSLQLFSLSLWGFLTYEGLEKELIKSISTQLGEAAFRNQTEIGNFLLPVKLQTQMLAEGPNSTFTTVENTKLLFHHLIRSRPELEEVSLVGNEGKELVRISRIKSYGKDEYRNLSEYALVQSALANVEKTSNIQFSEYLEPQLQLASPILINGKVDGIILTLINLKWIWQVVQEQKIGQTGYVYVVDDNLDLIGHNDHSLVLSRLKLPDTSVPLELFRGNHSSELLIYNNFNGQQVAGVSRFDPVNHWWVVVELPVEEGLAPLRRIINRFIYVFLVVVVISIVSAQIGRAHV